MRYFSCSIPSANQFFVSLPLMWQDEKKYPSWLSDTDEMQNIASISTLLLKLEVCYSQPQASELADLILSSDAWKRSVSDLENGYTPAEMRAIRRIRAGWLHHCRKAFLGLPSFEVQFHSNFNSSSFCTLTFTNPKGN